MPLVNASSGIILAAQTVVLTSFVDRFRGVIGRELLPGQAIGITACNWIHTYFVTCPLDLIYCDRAGGVLSIAYRFPMHRIGPVVSGSWLVWELRGGTLAQSRVAVGDILTVEQ